MVLGDFQLKGECLHGKLDLKIVALGNYFSWTEMTSHIFCWFKCSTLVKISFK